MAGFEQPNTSNVKSEAGSDGLDGLIEVDLKSSKDGALRSVYKMKDGTWILMVTRPASGLWTGFTPVTVKSNAEGKLDPGKKITLEQAQEFYQYAQDPKNIKLPDWAISE